MLFLQGQKISEELNMRISLSAVLQGCGRLCWRAAHSALSLSGCAAGMPQVCPALCRLPLAQTSLCLERKEAGSLLGGFGSCVLSQQICPALPGVSWSGHLPRSLFPLVLCCSWQHWGPVRSCVVPIVTLPGNRSQGLRGEQRLAL